MIQGAPGTGKTAVGLHRAAYLLYTLRAALSRSGVLVIGPNRAFMRYIERVLPSLGETTVVQKAVDELAAVRIRREEPLDLLRLKGDERMAEVLRRGLEQRVRPPRSVTRFRPNLRDIVVPPDDVARILRRVMRLSGTYREGREKFINALAAHVTAKATEAGAMQTRDAEQLLPAVLRDPMFQSAVDSIWPYVSPSELLQDLLTRSRLTRAAESVLEADEIEWLVRTPSGQLMKETWSAGDAPLIDEAQALIAGTPRTYGHVVVDEAQDLSPMQLRMIARRVPSGSMTVLGDVAQGIGPWANTDWEEVLRRLPGRESARVETLTIGYRVPGGILRLATRLLEKIAPTLEAPVSVREGEDPVFIRTSYQGLVSTVIREARFAMTLQGSVGVIAPMELVEKLSTAAPASGIQFDGADWGAGRKLTLLGAKEAKGLEFDHVIVAEPLAFLLRGIAGYRELYVALTRATKTLRIVHSGDLPQELRDPADAGRLAG